MSTRIIAAGVLAVAISLGGAAAASAQTRPEPADPTATSVQDRARLLGEERRSVSIAERRLIHHELVQSVVDGE